MQQRVGVPGVIVLGQQRGRAGELFAQAGSRQIGGRVGGVRRGLLVRVVAGGAELQRGVASIIEQLPGVPGQFPRDGAEAGPLLLPQGSQHHRGSRPGQQPGKQGRGQRVGTGQETLQVIQPHHHRISGARKPGMGDELAQAGWRGRKQPSLRPALLRGFERGPGLAALGRADHEHQPPRLQGRPQPAIDVVAGPRHIRVTLPVTARVPELARGRPQPVRVQLRQQRQFVLVDELRQPGQRHRGLPAHPRQTIRSGQPETLPDTGAIGDPLQPDRPQCAVSLARVMLHDHPDRAAAVEHQRAGQPAPRRWPRPVLAA